MLNITAQPMPTDIVGFIRRAVAATDEHGRTFKAAYSEGHDLDMVADTSPDIMCHSVYAVLEDAAYLWVADFEVKEAADLMVVAMNGAHRAGSANQGEAYSTFLMLEAARLQYIINPNLEYDTSWERAKELLREFRGSEFDDPEEDEWTCIVRFLNLRESDNQ